MDRMKERRKELKSLSKNQLIDMVINMEKMESFQFNGQNIPIDCRSDTYLPIPEWGDNE